MSATPGRTPILLASLTRESDHYQDRSNQLAGKGQWVIIWTIAGLEHAALPAGTTVHKQSDFKDIGGSMRRTLRCIDILGRRSEHYLACCPYLYDGGNAPNS